MKWLYRITAGVLIVGLIVFVYPKHSEAAGALVISGIKSSTGGASTAVTDAINTTGANLLVAVVTAHNAGATPTVSDNKGNSWTPRTEYQNNARVIIYYSTPTSVGTGHTFTGTASFADPAIVIYAFSGMAASSPYDVENGHSQSFNATKTCLPGTVTPTNDNEVVIWGFAGYNGISSGLAIDTGTATTAIQANGYGIGGSYEIQTAKTARNPTWSWTGATSGEACNAAAFTSAAATPLGNSTSTFATKQQFIARGQFILK